MIVALVALGIPLMVQGYSSGAPKDECLSMTPRHHVDPQRGAAPYDIYISKKNIRAGETVQISIKGRSDDDVIKGILVQARVGETAIGAFDASPSSQYIQLLDCGNGRGVSQILHIQSGFVWQCLSANLNRTQKILVFLSTVDLTDWFSMFCSKLFNHLLFLFVYHRVRSLTRRSHKVCGRSSSIGPHQRIWLNESTLLQPSLRTAESSGSLRNQTLWTFNKKL